MNWVFRREPREPQQAKPYEERRCNSRAFVQLRGARFLLQGPRFRQERKISQKRKFLARMSRGHPGVIRADIPAQNFCQGAQNPGKNKHLGADIHDPKVRTSTPPRDFQKLRSEELWAEFSFPIPLTGPLVPLAGPPFPLRGFLVVSL